MKTNFTNEYFDIVIVGGGIVGLTLAAALAPHSLKIAILDNKTINTIPSSDKFDLRVSALNHASQRILDNLDIWQEIADGKRLSEFENMLVWDSVGQSDIKFDCTEIGYSSLGYIVENSVLQNAILKKLSHYENISLISPVHTLSLGKDDDLITITTQEGHSLRTKLLVGADGANSWVREQAHISIYCWSYNHHAIVTTVEVEQSHQKTAWQCFLPTGPLALLPLADTKYCSVVWSTTIENSSQIMQMSDEDFNQAITSAFEFRLGKIRKVDQAINFPLFMRHAKSYVQSRLVLVGDAAHTIHPLAGQGVNLGIMDAACLAEVIIDAYQNQQDWGRYTSLRSYERWRKGDNWLMITAMEIFKRLFASDASPIIASRNLGLQLADRTAFIKNHFIHHALGIKGNLPKLAKASA